MRSRKQHGYLVSILSICVALLTVGYLSLAAYSARAQDSSRRNLEQTQAFYAAESGLILAEQSLPAAGKDAPQAGTWLSGKLSGAGSRFRVEIRPEDRNKDHFIAVSIGESEGRQGMKETSILQAKIGRKKGKAWTVEWRSK